MLQRINNETAIALKELGINEPCSMMYHKGELIGTKMGMHDKPNDYEGFYAAYYQEEVCKIFREKYNLFINVWYSFVFKVYDVDVYDLTDRQSTIEDFNTYEEAQLAGIKKAIKILKDE